MLNFAGRLGGLVIDTTGDSPSAEEAVTLLKEILVKAGGEKQ